MITLETKDKRWQEMREDLAKRLTAIGFGGDYDPDGTKNYNFTKRYSFRILNGTPTQINIEGTPLPITYTFENMTAITWGVASRCSFGHTSIDKLSQVQSIIRNWQLDWEKQLNGSK